MGHIRKIGDDYYVEFTARGLLYQQKAGPDRAVAQKLLKEIEDKIAGGEALTIVRDIELPVFFQQFVQEAGRQFSRKTVRRFEALIRHLSEYLHDRHPQLAHLSGITPRLVDGYKAYLVGRVKERKASSRIKLVNLALLLLREILEYGIRLGFINDNPALHVPLLEEKSRRAIGLADAEVKDLLQHATPAARELFLVVLSSGLTRHELKRACWEDVSWDQKSLTVLSPGKKQRTIPLDPTLMDILERRRGEGPARGLIWDVGVEMRDHANSFFRLRLTFAKRLLARDIPFLTVYRLLGLTDIAQMSVFLPAVRTRRDDLYFGIHKA